MNNVVFKILVSFFIGLCFWGCDKKIKSSNSLPKEQPNILLVIADDAGWNDVGYHGSKIKTPVLDSLANNGAKLERFYVAPTCSPSRAALLTGIPASRLGIVAPIAGKSKIALPDSLVTLPKAMKKLGYRTALFGKWHLGLTPENGPQAYGFDTSYGFLHGQIDQYTHEYKNGDPSWHKNGKFLKEDGHVTDLLTDAAIAYFNQETKTETPSFVTLAYSAPHFPLQEEERYKRPYRTIFTDSSRVDYAAAMTHLDIAFGRLLNSLKRSGKLDNTLILFMSDNGAMKNWYPKDQYQGKHGPNTTLGDNTPLKDYKTTNYEGAIRVPAFVYWKNHFNGKTLDDFIGVIDVLPTLVELTGASVKPNTIEGSSFLNLLNGASQTKIPQLYIRGHLQESIIIPPYKLIRTRSKKDTLLELYNVVVDPEEAFNLAASKPIVTNQLHKQLISEFAKDAATVNGPEIFDK
ncbi:sulfatase-like hydrolase/transferase [Croceivirga radicis]|uniref:sulfatase-like hydrolase/transferase n=1 Tax=Croceivirga radicis TaxID=1929488 RepID=UPI000255AE59|nr:sulfatase-like hydrolase/transferase [Croceivirga radicis]